MEEEAVPFSSVMDAECISISEQRERLGLEKQDGFLGLAFSGGGIRSATFNLGLLQGLADLKLLRHVDYLSTVSGGGYIGSWLMARMTRNDQTVTEVEKELSPEQSPDINSREWAPVQFLRDYSNYLTPQTGFLSADTWAMVAIWLRNTVLMQSVLALGLAAILLIARWAFFITESFAAQHSYWTVFAFFLLALAVSVCARGLRSFGNQTTLTQYEILVLMVAPLFLVCWYSAAAIWNRGNPLPYWVAPATGTLITLALISIQIFGKLSGSLRSLFYAVCCGAETWALVYALTSIAETLKHFDRDLWLVMSFGPVATIAALSLILTTYIGLQGRDMPDGQREWISRGGAWLNIFAGVWVALACIAVYAPYAVLWLAAKSPALLSTGTLGWVLSTAFGVFSGWSDKTSGSDKNDDKWYLTFAATYAPYVFVVGFLVVLSFVVHVVTLRILPPTDLFTSWSGIFSAVGFQTMQEQYWTLMQPTVQGWIFFAASSILGIVACLLSQRFDLNEFSMHYFYKNRLIRCYLGAARYRSRKDPRAADAFTGFDPRDDIFLDKVVRRPYHIINATLNLIHGRRLAWQERKATSFVFSPFYCGFDYAEEAAPEKTTLVESSGRKFVKLESHGYRPTSEYGGHVHLGTAMAISGAAVNPNMGSFTSSATAFLMTAFNVRMGWWLGNPRHSTKWKRPSPGTGIFYLMSELTGGANDERGFVDLSDGGHFENLGIYELIRRRCRYIIASDGSQDGHFAFEDLGNAIRKCRADFGVEIDIDLSQMRPDTESRRSRSHFAIGRITYPETARGAHRTTGYLLYIKASLTGDEPSDVLEYADIHREFPHQTTADQWFDESQFESYRRLGYHIGRQVPLDWAAPEAPVRDSTV